MIGPTEARPIIQAIAPAFTRPTLRRFVLLMDAALVCTGRRTVANLVRVAAPLVDGHVTTSQRVFSSASLVREATGLRHLPRRRRDAARRSADRAGRRRHRRRPPRPARRRQRPPPRPGPLQPRLHRLAVRPHVIATDTARWNLETTFQELRAWLGLETSRGWSRATVLRMAPCLFGLYTAVALLYQARPEEKRTGRPGGVGGEVGCDVLRRADGGAAMAVAGVGIPIGR